MSWRWWTAFHLHKCHDIEDSDLMALTEFTIAAALAIVLLLIPLPVYWRGRNVAVLVIISTAIIQNLFQFVNTIVWARSVRDVAPVWCDLSTNFSLYFPLAVEGAAFCVCKQLEWLSSPRITKSERPHPVWFEIVICCVLPLINLPIRYAVADHRYKILEGFGCVFSSFDSTLTTVLFFGPQLVFCAACLIYGALAARHLIRLRISLAAHLSNANTTINKSRFIRLLAFCLITGVWPICAVSLILSPSVSGDYSGSSWPGWKAVHASFHTIPTFRTAEQPAHVRQSKIAVFWTHPISGFLCFILVTTGEDVRNYFSGLWIFVKQRILRQRPHRPLGAPDSDRSSNHTTFMSVSPVIVIQRSTTTNFSSDSYTAEP